MTLPKRKLGSSDLEITPVGFGAWAIGGGGWAFGWGPQDDAASLAAMRRAIEAGINWIDTAAVYGLGHSEEVVGRFLRELPSSDRPLVFTKCGLRGTKVTAWRQPRRILRPRSIRAECEASLRRLGVGHVDLYQFHWPDETGTPLEDSWGEMGRLIEEGKVRAAGVSNFDVHLLDRCEAVRHVDSLQPPFSLIRRETAGEQIPWCAEHRTGVICYSPMQSGLLTDSFQRGAGCEIRPRRLAPSRPGVSGATAWPEPGTSRRTSAACPEAQHYGLGCCRRVGPRVARRDRRDRRRSLASADRWLDWRGDSPTHPP